MVLLLIAVEEQQPWLLLETEFPLAMPFKHLHPYYEANQQKINNCSVNGVLERHRLVCLLVAGGLAVGLGFGLGVQLMMRWLKRQGATSDQQVTPDCLQLLTCLSVHCRDFFVRVAVMVLAALDNMTFKT